jgi:hypothetical protein
MLGLGRSGKGLDHYFKWVGFIGVAAALVAAAWIRAAKASSAGEAPVEERRPAQMHSELYREPAGRVLMYPQGEEGPLTRD